MIREFGDWLTSSRLGELIEATPWVAQWLVPGVQSVHILCVSIVMISIVTWDLRLLGVTGKQQTVAYMTNRVLPWVWTALAILALTGATLTIIEPARELLSPAFQAKMVMLAIVCSLTIAVQRSVRRDASYWESRRPLTVVAAVVSLLLWVAILSAGRWIAYVEQV